jgi:hypothetical protein
MGEPMTDIRRGIGVNQGRVLGLLVLMEPRPMSGNLLATMAYPSGDMTQGRRVLVSLLERGLIERATATPFRPSEGRGYWSVTAAGRESFYVWFRNRVADLEGLPT